MEWIYYKTDESGNAEMVSKENFLNSCDIDEFYIPMFSDRENVNRQWYCLGDKILGYREKAICSYDECLKCSLLECMTGQVARNEGIEGYKKFLLMLDDAEENV